MADIVHDTGGSDAPSPTASAMDIVIQPPQARPDPWKDLGFEATDDPKTVRVPSNILIVAGSAEGGAYRELLSTLPGPPLLNFAHGSARYSAYRIPADMTPVSDAYVPAGCQLLRPGDLMPLPDASASGVRARLLSDLPELTAQSGLVESPPPASQKTSLSAFSLRGRAEEFEANLVEPDPLLGKVCFSGQATVWYGPPNAGKTLIGLSLLGDAVQGRRVQPDNVFYINADDSSAGFAAKMRLMDDLGVHTLAPGHRGFECAKLSEHLLRCVTDKTARGIIVIIDTLKKFADLMHKGQSSAFADACRLFVMNGGTVLAFAHTNKNVGPNGKLTYSGTADILQDFDAAYLMTPLEAAGRTKDSVVRFDAIKRRGHGAECTAYSYAAEDGISYDERLLSVREVDPDMMDEFERAEMERADEEVIEAIRAVIRHGIDKKMELAKAVARHIQVSERRALKVLEAYTGDDPSRHHWSFAVKARGAKVFTLLPPPATDIDPAP